MRNNVLTGMKVAFLATEGLEQVELERPRLALDNAGATTVLLAPQKDIRNGRIKAWHMTGWGDSIAVDESVSQALVSDYDMLVLPGGVMNPDRLRLDPDAVNFVREFAETGKPLAAICHGPWTLIEAGVARGRTLTSWPSLKTDLTNAGATWVDSEVVDDYNLITSRSPDDIPAFSNKLIEVLSSERIQRRAA